jgi:hypothetical protein
VHHFPPYHVLSSAQVDTLETLPHACQIAANLLTVPITTLLHPNHNIHATSVHQDWEPSHLTGTAGCSYHTVRAHDDTLLCMHSTGSQSLLPLILIKV